nr:BTAD domain-containing putative transcriptional regulator [Kibdelosporangium sp. MJ126-NF4]CEL18109.1 putative regulatory protein [Kibdelosporangium sp. MJ126-NF4]CTQ90662.1 putative regulatory protein [Kibdelosporangium sp. MJ126-NF4]
MDFRMLGSLEVGQAGKQVELRGRRQRSLLAGLLLRANLTSSVTYITDAVWENPPSAPDSNIRTYVTGLRRQLREPGEPSPRLQTRTGGYLLVVHDGELDVAVFEQLADRAGAAMANGDYARAADDLRKALDLWRGEPLEGLNPTPLLHAEVLRLQERRLTVLEQHARAQIELNGHKPLVGELRQLVARHPLREELWALLMLAQSRSGRQADALAAFNEAREHLVRELGIEPGPQLRQLREQIRRGDETVLSSAPSAVALQPRADDARRQLPMDIAEFTGREPELRALHRLVDKVDADKPASTAVVISTIEGMAGVGKTRLAVRAAHQLVGAGRFAEIQFWTDLRGFSADEPPADPAGVLESLLRALGVHGDEIPQGLDERAALYRTKLSGREALVLLDNAVDADQVRPLLPGSPTCLVLITSRHRLAGLDGAQPLSLDVFSTEEGVALVARIIGAQRVAAEPAAARRVVELCGHLPIAITLAARRLQARPRWTLVDLVGRLDATDQRLNQLSDGSRAVRAAFDLSYQVMPVERQRMFRLLGLHPGQDFAAHSAAALFETTPAHAEALLEDLLDEHLIEQQVPGRYGLHDLLRNYAHDCVRQEDDQCVRHAATERVLGWYLHTAAIAGRLLQPRRERVTPDSSCAPAHTMRMSSRIEALRWFETERGNLVATVHMASEHGFDRIAWQLPLVLLDFFYLRKYWQDWIATHRIALAAATRLGDQAAQAKVLNGLGVAYSDLGDYSESIECHLQALEIERAAGDLVSQAWNLNNMGVGFTELLRLDEAADHLRESVALHRTTGDQYGEGVALTNLADACRVAKRLTEATRFLREALGVQQAQGDNAGQHFTLCSMGDVAYDSGQHELAIQYYEKAIAFSRAIGDQWSVAHVLTRLVRPWHTEGRAELVRERAPEALRILEELGATKAGKFRGWLREHGCEPAEGRQ